MTKIKHLVLLAALLLPTAAVAQNKTCPTAPPGTSDNECASTEFVTRALPTVPITIGVTPVLGGTSGRVIFDNGGKAGEYTQTQLTAQINQATSSLPGLMPAWPNNTTTYLRGDDTFRTLNCAAIVGAGTGCSSAAGITALTGDVAATGSGSVAATLATVNSNVGTFGSSSLVPVVTVNGKGLITAVTTASIPSAPTAANPTALVGLTAVNGSAATFMRSDAAPPLSQAITPVWTGLHTFDAGVTLVSPTGTAIPLIVNRGFAQGPPPSSYANADQAAFYYYADFTPFHRFLDIVAGTGGTTGEIRFFTGGDVSTAAVEAGRFDGGGNLILQAALNVTSTNGGIYNHGTPSATLTGNNFGGGPAEHYASYNNITAAPNSGAYASAPQISFANVINSSYGAGDPGVYFVGTGSVATMHAGSAPAWAQTNVITIMPSVGSYQATGAEIDLNNWNMNYTPAMAAAGHTAANLILTGTNNDGAGHGGYATAAIVIAFGGSTTNPMWDFGIVSGITGFKTFNTAFISDVSSATYSILLGGAHTTGIDLTTCACTFGLNFANDQNAVNAVTTLSAVVNMIKLDSSDRIVIGASGSVINAPSVATGTPTASLCLDSSGNIIKKTTAGACI